MKNINLKNILAIRIIYFFSATVCLSLAGIFFATNDLSAADYTYRHEGRHDPFKPFVTAKAVSQSALDPNEIVDEQVVFSGMQMFEPGQLTVVGVMFTSHEPLALVEDQTNKGYIIKIGTLIGKRGVVTSIDDQKVIVTETAKTRSGKEIKSTIAMKLKKEGDK